MRSSGLWPGIQRIAGRAILGVIALVLAFLVVTPMGRYIARAAWAEFELGLRRHIGFEEEILFPGFEAGTGMSPQAGPTAVMRIEHREIERLLEAIRGALAGIADPLPLRTELHRVLAAHNMKEEQVLYPMTDRALGPEESDILVSRIQAS